MAEENVCADCGHEGPEGPGEGRCPMCGGDMLPADDIDDDLNEDFEEEEGEELAGEEVGDEDEEGI